MEVENVGKNPLMKPVNKKAWIIGFSVVGVVIVGLIVAIVVVLATRGNRVSEEAVPAVSSDLTNEQARSKYFEITDEINEEIANLEYDPNGVLDLYLQKIREAEDEKVKLLLNKDYYYMMSVYNVGDDNVREHVMEGLIEIDNKLQMLDTALMIVNRADYYGDENLKNKYNEIADKRLNVSEEEIQNIKSGIQEIIDVERRSDED